MLTLLYNNRITTFREGKHAFLWSLIENHNDNPIDVTDNLTPEAYADLERQLAAVVHAWHEKWAAIEDDMTKKQVAWLAIGDRVVTEHGLCGQRITGVVKDITVRAVFIEWADGSGHTYNRDEMQSIKKA